MEIQHCFFCVSVDSTFFHSVKKIFHAAEDIKELIDPYVNFSFAGQQVSSKIVYTCSHPEFNQELRLGLKVRKFLHSSIPDEQNLH